MGRDCLNGGYARIESLEFPVEAFKDFLSAERMPLPDFWQTKTGSTGGHIKPAPSLPNEFREVEPSKTALAAAPSVAPGIEGAGVAVGHIRALFDQSGERYSPELAAAVWAWSSFEECPEVAAGCTVKEEIKNGRLSDWEGPPLLPTARERIAVIVNWNKTPAKQ